MNYKKVIDLVIKAGKYVFDDELKSNVEMKGAADFVTAVDLKISAFLKEELALISPDVGFMSEEESGGLQSKCWILDPIDGTTNLVYNYNMSSVSLALCVDGRIEFGVVYNPFNGDTFVCERGKGVYLNGKLLPKAPDRDPKDCLIEFGAGSTKKQYADEVFEVAKNVFKNCLDIRRICSSALAVSYVAAGKINGYFERVLKPWDYAAATLFLEECGAKCCDWDGNPIRYDAPTSFVCGTPKALDFLLGVIGKR
ncbi:MAG: inositol monophosphatase [Clostridiales bacterium]|nr:inositol monophosphatase [Clostridiales bacterium]